MVALEDVGIFGDTAGLGDRLWIAEGSNLLLAANEFGVNMCVNESFCCGEHYTPELCWQCLLLPRAMRLKNQGWYCH